MLKILEGFAGNAGLFLCDMALVFLNPYQGPFGRESYPAAHQKEPIREFFKRMNARAEERLAFSQTLYHLKRDGLIIERQGKFTLTTRGLLKRKQLQLKQADALPEPRYTKEISTELKIVVFDIPEAVARQRTWLRSVLKNLGYRMLQKSVWVGKTKIPESLVRDLRRLKLFPYVEILAVTKQGSLRQVV